jgi:DNA-binding transcriptional regulator LsrR (DeoR family)
MAVLSIDRPSELVLAARVARLYYLEGASKIDIAERLGISRFRVARLLETARREGVVNIEVLSPPGYDTDLAVRLEDAFGLARAVVLTAEEDQVDTLRDALGSAAKDVLHDVVSADDVVGLAWARSLRGIGHGEIRLAPCPIVQMTGALPGPDGSDVLELVRRVARGSGGAPHVFYAPLIAPDVASARSLLRQPQVRHALELVSEVTVAAVGIGAWRTGLSTIYDSIEPEARRRARDLGVVGEISGVLIDSDGRALVTPLSKRIVGVSGRQLRRIGTVIAVAYDAAKVDAVFAALRGGMVNGLVTHAGLARGLLALAESADRSTAGELPPVSV